MESYFFVGAVFFFTEICSLILTWNSYRDPIIQLYAMIIQGGMEVQFHVLTSTLGGGECSISQSVFLSPWKGLFHVRRIVGWLDSEPVWARW